MSVSFLLTIRLPPNGLVGYTGTVLTEGLKERKLDIYCKGESEST